MVKKAKRFSIGWTVAAFLVINASAATDGGLIDAVKAGDGQAVRSLIQQHVDVNEAQSDGASALHWAVYRNDLAVANMLISAGANVNATNDYGVPPLWLACTNRSSSLVESLLNAGANANAALPSGETVLMTCARTGNTDSIRPLIARGANVNTKESWRGQTALMWAVEQKHAEAAQILLENGADVHARSKSGFTPLLFATRVGDIDSARVLLAAGADVNEVTPTPPKPAADQPRGFSGKPYSYRAAPYAMTPLLMAAASGHESLALFLLDHGANPNAADSNGVTALHYAVLEGIVAIGSVSSHYAVNAYLFRPNMIELTKALLAHGANPNARLTKDPLLPGGMPRVSMAGATPFLLATASCDLTLMHILLDAGADPMIATKAKTTTLMIAAGLGRYEDRTKEEEKNAFEAVKLLVGLGADVNAIGEEGYTALHGAAYVGADPIIDLLISRGAKTEVKDDFGQTPLSIAEGVVTTGIFDFAKKPWGTHRQTADLLLKLGATPLAQSGVKVLDLLKDAAAGASIQ